MIGMPVTDTLQNATMSAVIFEGLTIETRDGQPARLAIIDNDGNVLDAGPAVAREVWNVSIKSYKEFLAGNGHLRVHCEPPCQQHSIQTAA